MNDYILQLQKQLDSLTKQVDGLVKPEVAPVSDYAKAAALYLNLPCLRFLGLGGLGSAGEWRDQSGNGMDLSYNGNPQMGFTTQGAPYWAYDGTGDYHSHADDANFDITGTETTVLSTQRGMTCGAWVYLATLTPAVNAIIAKWGSGGNLSYILAEIGGKLYFIVSVDGVAQKSVVGAAMTTGTWYFTVGRFVPSTSVADWVNDSPTANVTTIPASIFSGAGTFNIGNDVVDGSLLDGAVAFPFICSCALSDALITQLYQSSRGLFGV